MAEYNFHITYFFISNSLSCCFPINIIRLDIKFETNYASRRMFGEPIKRGHSFALLLGIYSDGIPSTDFVLLSNKDRASFLKDYQTYVSEYVRQD